jgi:hypothetical protein
MMSTEDDNRRNSLRACGHPLGNSAACYACMEAEYEASPRQRLRHFETLAAKADTTSAASPAPAVPSAPYGLFMLHENDGQWGAYQVSNAYASDPKAFRLYTASQQPAAPAVPSTGGREAFEAWFKPHSKKVHLERCGETYFGDWAACAWEGWQARAALAAQPLPAPTSEPKGWREALEFYANGNHQTTLTNIPRRAGFDWDDERRKLNEAGFFMTCENSNGSEDFVEDGSVAAAALAVAPAPAASVEDSAPMDGGFHEGYADGFDAGLAAASVEDAGRETLTETAIHNECPPDKYGVEGLSNFAAGVRFAERFHGIAARAGDVGAKQK